jgi:hypothetical protein
MRRLIIIGSIATALLIVLIIGLSLWLKSTKAPTSDALRAIPLDAGLVIKVNSFSGILLAINSDSQLWSNLKQYSLISKADSTLLAIDSISKMEPALQQALKSSNLFVSVHIVGNNEPQLLVTANLPSGISGADLEGLFQKYFEGKFSISEKGYNGATLLTAESGTGQNAETYTLSAHKGVVLFSPSSLLVERAIKQLVNVNSLLTDKAFQEILKTAGTKIEANIFVNHKFFPALFSKFVAGNFQKGFMGLHDAAHWTELDPIFKPDAIFLNGFSQAPDSINAYYQIYANQKPIKMSVHDVLPAQTAAFVFLGISNIDSYLQDYRKYLDRAGNLREYRQSNELLAKNIGTDPLSFYSSFFSKELALAYVPFNDANDDENWFVVAGTKGKSLAQDEVERLIDAYATKQSENPSKYELTYKVDKDKSIKIFRFPSGSFHKTLFGSLFNSVSDEYLTFIDSYIVYGSSFEALSRFALANVHNRQLSAEPWFREFSLDLVPESNFTLFVDPRRASGLSKNFLHPKNAVKFKQKTENLKNFQGLAFQLIGGKQIVFNNIYLKSGSSSTLVTSTSSAPQTVWETRLDTTISSKPALVINHITQGREIFVQDNLDNIYLINEAGRILWKKALSEAIIGEVSQVDLFKNRKLQLLFNTRNYLHAIDRNGNNVDGFPVKLQAPATNPVAIFDYERNREYRYFLAGEDRKIYAFDKNGKKLLGWEFDRTERVVTKPLQHFRINGLDYITCSDANRPYILDRKGKERLKPQRLFSPARNSTFLVDEGTAKTPTRFVTTDSLGVVRFIYLDGRVDDKILGTMSPAHFFDFQDVNADGVEDFITLDDKKLAVFNSEGKEIFTKKFSDEVLPKVFYFHFGASDRKLGVVSQKSSHIYLINSDGSFYKDFPLRGITPFSIGRFASTKTKFNLIVGANSGYIINYAVY